jgi:undecaprenyl-diphosphatase
MDLIQILVLAIIQGLTEFLPISSSAHLILSPYLFGFADQGLAFDIAVHLGSLFAVMLYFRREIVAVTGDWFKSLPGNGKSTANSRLGWAIILGTIPVVIAGLMMKTLVETSFRSPLLIAATTIGFGLLLWWADVRASRTRELSSLGWKDALFIGLAQALALVPGTSRSGITMTAALMLGFNRRAASRFSFLLAIPTILMSAALVTKDLIESDVAIDWTALGLGVILSFVAALTTIYFFLRFIERMGMKPFVIYRLLLGAVILAIIYW